MKVLRISNLERTIFQNIKKRKQGRTLLIGMNGSPLYSLLLQRKGIDGSFLLVVQTPTLYMIYQLQEEIKHFKNVL